MSICIWLVAVSRLDGCGFWVSRQGRLEVLLLTQLHHRTDGNPMPHNSRRILFCCTIGHPYYGWPTLRGYKPHDAHVFLVFYHYVKELPSKPTQLSNLERLGDGEPLGADNHRMNQNSNAIIQPIVDISIHMHKISDIWLRIIATSFQNHYGKSQLSQSDRFDRVCLRVCVRA